jgi:hypothetical protein
MELATVLSNTAIAVAILIGVALWVPLSASVSLAAVSWKALPVSRK